MAGHVPPETDACGVAVVADRRGRASRDVVQRGLAALRRLASRRQSATRANLGAGILTAIPWDLVSPELPAALRDPTTHRIAGMFALDPAQADRAILAARSALGRLGWHVMSWREVPTAPDALAPESRAHAPCIVQCFARASRHRQKRTPYRTRLAIEARWLRLGLNRCFVTSLSDCTLVYKALVDPLALDRFFPDLADPRFVSAFAVVHHGFSGNTWVRWDLTQPFHAIAHAGEIHTIGGNRLWMDARIGDAGIRDESDLLKAGGSDSQTLDAAIQWQRETGLSTPQALARLIPPSWTLDEDAAPEVRAFHRYESCFAEPWDGPAAIAFADGRYAGAMLDASHERPLQTVETSDFVCIASEREALDPSASASQLGHLAPGEMLVLDQQSGTVLRGEAVWRALSAGSDYAEAVSRIIHRLPGSVGIGPSDDRDSAAAGERALFDYFRPRHASRRQEARGHVSLRTLLGRRGQWSPHGLRPVLLELDSPVLTQHQLDALLDQDHVRAAVLPIAFETGTARPAEALRRALADLQRTAVALVANGTRILVLTDRTLESGHARIPSLLATAVVDEGLRSARVRLRASIAVDAGDVRSAHDAAVLASFGASALVGCGQALETGLRDILWKSRVSSFEAYCGARLLDAVGLDPTLTRYFRHVASLPGSLSMEDVAAAAATQPDRRWAAEPVTVRA